MSYAQLSLPERIRLHHLRYTEHLSISETASRMERAKSTISRELKRNRLDQTLYLPAIAHQKMQTRWQQAKQPFTSVSLAAIAQLKQCLEQYHSPEQICGGLRCVLTNPYHSWERGLHEHTNGLLRTILSLGDTFQDCEATDPAMGG
jgi:IS30 family transposase